ncbi:TPA: hypothetical protein ACRR0B_005013, partial [Citrobacter werkmanii]
MTTNNHPAHGPVSLDRLHQIREILSKASAQSDGGNLGYAMADAVKVINGVIAAFGAEPVAWLHSDNGIGIPAITRSRNVADSWFSKGWNIKPLYTTPPATVVPDEMTPVQASRTYGDEVRGYRDGWNAYRAAMLQGAEPVTTAYKLRDAVEIIRNSGIEIDAEKIFAERDTLNTPDCWCRTCRPVTVSDMRFVVCPECGNKRCPHANDHRHACTGSNEPGQEGSAYPAAPQQEVKAALEHGM